MPRIEMTRTVRIALLGLRIYLIVLLALILLKFVRDFTASSAPAEPRSAIQQPAEDRLLRALSARLVTPSSRPAA
jgi:hypothetical protein